MRKLFILYLCYPNCQTLSSELSWSHYSELLSISDKSKRNFYEKEKLIEEVKKLINEIAKLKGANKRKN
jgi:Protein of unknown function (DUF1016).